MAVWRWFIRSKWARSADRVLGASFGSSSRAHGSCLGAAGAPTSRTPRKWEVAVSHASTPLAPVLFVSRHAQCSSSSRKHRSCRPDTHARHLDPLPAHCAVDKVESSDNSSVHTTPSLRGSSFPASKTDVDSHFRLEAPEATSSGVERQDEQASSAESPPPFSSHNFPSRYFPAPSPADPYRALVTECVTSESLTVSAPAPPPGPAPPFEESCGSTSSVVAETKAALPRDTKDGQGSKDLDDGEPPPPYTEGSSPLDGFTYVMAAAGSIITQVQQGGPAPINTALGGGIFIVIPA